MTEDDLESTPVESELVPSNQLQKVVKESGLAKSEAQFLLGKFEEDFKNVAIWAKKASKIVVTDDSQKVLMEEARTGRLFLAKIRIEVEKNRKALKDESLKRGRAIDTVANFIKDLIIPTEEHLNRQEKFVEFKEKAHNDKLLADAKAKEEEDRLKKEKEDKEELEELRLEKVEALKKDAEKIREEEKLLKGNDVEKLIAFKLAVLSIKIPVVKNAENIRLIEDAKSHLHLAVHKIQLQEEI